MNYKKIKLNKKAIGKRIRDTILSSPYSFKNVAEMLNLSSERSIYYWIKGIKIPSLENLVNISVMFNKKIEDFIIID